MTDFDELEKGLEKLKGVKILNCNQNIQWFQTHQGVDAQGKGLFDYIKTHLIQFGWINNKEQDIEQKDAQEIEGKRENQEEKKEDMQEKKVISIIGHSMGGVGAR